MRDCCEIQHAFRQCSPMSASLQLVEDVEGSQYCDVYARGRSIVGNPSHPPQRDFGLLNIDVWIMA